jgi:two-component system sensor histidine kinase UhpB
LHLLIRKTLMGMLCWRGVSIYLVGQSGRRALQAIGTMADQMQPMVATDVMRRLISMELDARYPDLSSVAARFPDPMCLRYSALDESNSDWGCSQSPVGSDVPIGIARVLRALGRGHVSVQREITVNNRPVGIVRELLGLTAVTLLALDLLAFWVIGRALRPTAKIVTAIEQLGEGMNDVRLPALRPREFRLIASGINRLAKRLADSYAARAELTARLIRVQEDERREPSTQRHRERGAGGSRRDATGNRCRANVVLTARYAAADEPAAVGTTGSAVGSGRSHHGLADQAAWLPPYRIVQESLSNIARHAPTSQTACVYIRQKSPGVHVRVSNDLVGVTADRGTPRTGMGLKLLGERMRSLHGIFSVEVSAVEFAVQADLPTNAQ